MRCLSRLVGVRTRRDLFVTTLPEKVTSLCLLEINDHKEVSVNVSLAISDSSSNENEIYVYLKADN